MYLGPAVPELNCLPDIGRMCVARVHPIVQVYSARPGQTAYVGLVLDLVQKVDKRCDNLPPRPTDLHILLISRPATEERRKNVEERPLL